MSSPIAFSLNVASQNKHREGIFSLYEPFECVFLIEFFSRFCIKKQIHFYFMESFYVSSQIVFSLNVESQNKHRKFIFPS